MKKNMILLLALVLFLSITNNAYAAAQPNRPLFIIEPQYKSASHFKDGMAYVSNGGSSMYIDHTGSEVFKLKYDPISHFYNGVAVVEQNGKKGLMNSKGDLIVDFKYDYINNKEKLILVGTNIDKFTGKTQNYGIIDTNGKEIIKPQYNNYFGKIYEDRVLYRTNGKYGYLDSNGKVIITPQYEDGHQFSNGLAAVRKNGKWGYIDKKGKVIIGFKYNGATSFSEGVAAVRSNGKDLLIDPRGKVLLGAKENIDLDDWGPSFKEGFIEVDGNGNKSGFMNKQGKVVIKPQYDLVFPFEEGLARVEVNRKYGLIDKQGKLIVKPQYDDIGSFSEGLAPFEKNGKYGFLDKKGNVVISAQFDSVYIESFKNGIAPVEYNGFWGYIAHPNEVSASSKTIDVEVNKAIDLNLVPSFLQYKYKDSITRKEFSKILVELLAKKNSENFSDFFRNHVKDKDIQYSDIGSDEEIFIVSSLGIVTGENGKFNPNTKVTRQEAAVMLAKTAQLLGMEMPINSIELADRNQIADYAVVPVQFVTTTIDSTNNAKIMGLIDNKFFPNNTITKEQAIMMIKRLYNAQ